MKIELLSLSFLIFLLIGCTSSSQKEDDKCQTSPSPIFSDTMKIVDSHSFELEKNGENSYEEAVLNNGVSVEVLQSGCNIPEQEFRITRKGDYTKEADSFWIAGAFQTIGVLSNSSPALKGLEQYANIMAKNAESTKLGQAYFPDPTLSVTLDKIADEKSGTIIIKLKEVVSTSN